jgi:transketolase
MAGTTVPPGTHRKMGKATREAFGHALAKLGEELPDVVVVDGDVHNSTHTGYFAKKFPPRFFNVGIAESDMVGIASGLAASGKRAWVSSFACFILCNAYDQLRMSVAFPGLDVKVVGTARRCRWSTPTAAPSSWARRTDCATART